MGLHGCRELTEGYASPIDKIFARQRPEQFSVELDRALGSSLPEQTSND